MSGVPLTWMASNLSRRKTPATSHAAMANEYPYSQAKPSLLVPSAGAR